jgi:hypothetical protein
MEDVTVGISFFETSVVCYWNKMEMMEKSENANGKNRCCFLRPRLSVGLLLVVLDGKQTETLILFQFVRVADNGPTDGGIQCCALIFKSSAAS